MTGRKSKGGNRPPKRSQRRGSSARDLQPKALTASQVRGGADKVEAGSENIRRVKS